MPDNPSVDVQLQASGQSPIILPNGASAANAQFTRDGMDLYLTSPNGHAIKIDGYFGHDPSPDLVSADGGRLSPQMVDAFLPPQHPNEVASNTGHVANDASAVGKVTEVVGDATITHTDGTHVKIETGMAVHMGDVIQTSAKGAVHILFVDNTTFAVSESARLSIDNYTYNAEEHTGTSFFSMLHGVFVYTSGLIGKNDPGNVNIETPVGSIGIRGTVVAGDINDAGQPSTITIVDGAIVVTNGGGELQMSTAFDTATLTTYSTAPADAGPMSTQSFGTTYSAVAPADPGFYALTGSAPPAHEPTAPAPQTTPDGMTMTTPDATTAGTKVAAADTGTVTVTDALDPTAGTITVNDPTITTPPSDTTFTDSTAATATFGTTPDGTTTFATVPVTAPATGGTIAVGGTTTSGGGTTTVVSGGGTGGAGTGSTNPPPVTAQFNPSDPYTNGTPGTLPSQTADDGIPLFGPLLASTFMNTAWTTSIQLGTIATTGLVNPTFGFSGANVTVNAGGGWDINGVTLQANEGVSGIVGDTVLGASAPIMHVDINTAGVVTLTFIDPLAALPNIQAPGTFNFSFSASDANSTVTMPFGFQFQPSFLTAMPQVFVGDQLLANSPDTIMYTGNAIAWGKGGDDSITVGGGNSLVMGDNGNDTLTWTGGGTVRIYGGNGNDTIAMKDPSFTTDGVSKVDGGAGTNTLQAGVFFDNTAHTFNLEGATNITNIQNVTFGSNLTTVQTVQLNFQSIFDMNTAHSLTISDPGGFASAVILDSLGNVTGTSTAGAVTTITGVTNGNSVTLIIDQTNGPISLTVN